MILGILSLVAACLCWSLVFIIPLLLKDFSPIEIALGRFFCYGFISIVLLMIKRPHLLNKNLKPLWIKSSIYGFASTILCFTSMVFSIRLASSAVTALIYSLSPIMIALYGNFKNRQYSFKKLMTPLLVMLTGIAFANVSAFQNHDAHFLTYTIGIIFGFLGIGSWSWYAVANAEFLGKNKDIRTEDWSLMMGSSMFAFVVLIALALSPFMSWNWTRQFLIGSFMLGAIGTWLAFLFWNYGAKKVPVALAGQMLILEVVFGLILVYSHYHKWPESFELVGMIFMLIGVLISTKTLRQKQALSYNEES